MIDAQSSMLRSLPCSLSSGSTTPTVKKTYVLHSKSSSMQTGRNLRHCQKQSPPHMKVFLLSQSFRMFGHVLSQAEERHLKQGSPERRAFRNSKFLLALLFASEVTQSSTHSLLFTHRYSEAEKTTSLRIVAVASSNLLARSTSPTTWTRTAAPAQVAALPVVACQSFHQCAAGTSDTYGGSLDQLTQQLVQAAHETDDGALKNVRHFCDRLEV